LLLGDKASERVLGVLVRLDVVDDVDDVDEVVDANEWLDMDGDVDVDENDDERRYLLFIFSPLFASPPFSGMSLEVGDDSLLSVDDVFSSYISAMQIFTPLVDAAAVAADDSAVSSTISRMLLSGSSFDFSFIIVVVNDRFSTAISIFVIYISLI
jgi:hypothetical protein